jgi:hypothetical protein
LLMNVFASSGRPNSIEPPDRGRIALHLSNGRSAFPANRRTPAVRTAKL